MHSSAPRMVPLHKLWSRSSDFGVFMFCQFVGATQTMFYILITQNV